MVGDHTQVALGSMTHRHRERWRAVLGGDCNGEVEMKTADMNPITSFLVLIFMLAGFAVGYWVNPYLAPLFFVTAAIIALSLKMANAWPKFVILRMGKLQSVKGTGLFAIIPVLDSVAAVIDGRIQTTAFNAEQALTRDTVPVNVDGRQPQSFSDGTGTRPREQRCARARIDAAPGCSADAMK
jgi:SPFH domain / Band 7 family